MGVPKSPPRYQVADRNIIYRPARSSSLAGFRQFRVDAVAKRFRSATPGVPPGRLAISYPVKDLHLLSSRQLAWRTLVGVNNSELALGATGQPPKAPGRRTKEVVRQRKYRHLQRWLEDRRHSHQLLTRRRRGAGRNGYHEIQATLCSRCCGAAFSTLNYFHLRAAAKRKCRCTLSTARGQHGFAISSPFSDLVR
jgi:hypothetical protein